MKKIFSLTLLLISMVSHSQTPTGIRPGTINYEVVTDIPMNYPFSGPVSAIAVDPLTSQHIVVAGVSSGLFETRNAGSVNRTWKHLSDLKQHEITDVLITPAPGGDEVWAVASNTYDDDQDPLIWKRNTAGVWRKISFNTPMENNRRKAYRLVYNPYTGNVYACGEFGIAIFYKQGVTPDRSVKGGPNGEAVYAMDVLQNGTIIAGTGSGIYYQTTSGARWVKAANFPTFNSESRFCIRTDGSRTIAMALGLNSANNNYSAYSTIDNGGSWQRFASVPGSYTVGTGGLPFIYPDYDPSSGQMTVYVSNCYKFIYASSTAKPIQTATTLLQRDASLVWKGNLEPNVIGHADSRHVAFLRQGIYPSKMIITSDGGLHIADITGNEPERFAWRTENCFSGLKSLQATTITGNASRFYFGTWHDGFGSSTDGGSYISSKANSVTGDFGGEGWVLKMNGFPGSVAPKPIVLGDVPKFSDLIFGISRNPDKLWNSPPGSGPNEGPVYCTGRSYIQQADKPAGARAFPWKITNDEGNSWQGGATCRYPRFGFGMFAAAAGRPADVSLFIGLNDGGTIKLGKLVKPLNESDATFQYPALNGLHGGLAGMSCGNNYWTALFCVNPSNADVIIASEFDSGEIARSTDGGNNWTILPSFSNLYRAGSGMGRKNLKSLNGENAIFCIAYSPFEEGVILVGTVTEGMFLTRDNGNTWKKLNNPGVMMPTSIHWPSKSLLYVATYGRGLFKINL